MAQRNFTDSEEAEIAKLYTVGGFGVKQIKRAYGYKYHISFSHALKRQGVKIRSNHENNRLYDLNPHVFDVIDNEHAAYWLGFIYADGCVHNRTLLVSLNRKDIKQLEMLKEFLETEQPIKISLVSATGTTKKYKHCNLSVTHIHLAKRLKQLGINTNRPNVNKCLSQIPEYLHRHWLRGIFDGDGSWHSKPGMNICGKRDEMEACRKILVKAGASPIPQVYKHQIADVWYINYGGRRQCQMLARWMYQNATVWMERKRKIPFNWPKPQKRTRNKLGQWE